MGRAGVRIDPRAARACDDLVSSRPRNESFEKRHLQVAAMDGELRLVVAGKLAGRLAVNELAEAVVEAELAGQRRNTRQRLFETKRNQFTRGMRQDVDADTDRPDLGVAS
jgi:hypothetical protein